MSDLNKELTRKAVEEIWNKANFAVLDQTHTPDYIHRGSALPETAGLEALKQFVTALRAGFPDGRFTIEDMVSEGDTVVARWRFTGTHQGEWFGIPATGKPVNFAGTSANRVVGGRMAEQLWADWEVMAMLQQLGVVSDPAALEANKALCRAWLEVWNETDLTEVDRLVSTDFLYQATGLPDIRGGERVKELIQSLHQGFPDGRFVLEEVVATAGGGVNRWSYSGTHQGEWMGLAPTGKVVRVTGTTWVRTSGGKIVHQWCDWDAQGMLEQLTGSGPAEANKALVRRYMEEIWNQGNLAVVDEVFAADSFFHGPGLPTVQGRDARKQFVTSSREGIPDIHVTIDELIGEGSKVVMRWSWVGIHRGEWMGVAATGKQLSCNGTSTFRMAEGMIAEEFVQWDGLGVMQQLGAI